MSLAAESATHRNVAVLLDVPAHEPLHEGLERDADVGLDRKGAAEGEEEGGVARHEGGVDEVHDLERSGGKHPRSRRVTGTDVRRGSPIVRSPPEFCRG